MTQEEAEKRIKELCQYPIPEGFLDAEERNGYLVSAKMKRVWAVQLDMVQKVLDVCKKHGLRIWAEGGTLLGAVRHHGYIPWDDDIDLMMLRKDYDRLVQIAPEEFTHPYFFQSYATEKRYPRSIAQIRMDGTTGMLDFHGEMWIHFHQGICIDIFPLDEVPSDAETEKKFREELESKIYTLKSSVYFNILHPFRSLRLMRNFDKFTVECEDCSRRYNDGSHDKIAILSVNCISRNKSWYDETVYLPFEYLSIPVPTCYHDNLSAQYGDYMTPVQGSTEHAFWILDPDTDYHNYLPEQKRIFNKIRRNNLVKRVKNIIKRILCKNS